MTLFSQLRFFQVNRKALKQITTMNVPTLMVFVLLFLASSLVHADHLTEQSTNIEQLDCYLCHQGIDTPPELPQVQVLTIISYFLSAQSLFNIEFKGNYFVQPQLRAPPVFQ